MSERRTTPAPFLAFDGGINTNTSLVDMAPNEAEDILNCDITTEKTVKRRRAFDFIGEKSGESLYFETGLNYEGKDVAPSVYAFSAPSTEGTLLNFIVAHVGNEIRVWDSDDWLSLRNDPIQTISLGSAITEGAKWYKTKWESDRNKLFILNRGIALGYIYVTSDNTLDYTPISVQVRDLDVDSPDSDSQVNNDGNNYLCISSHTSSDATEPGVGESWRAYWVLYGPELDGGDAWAVDTDYTSNIVTVDKTFTTICFSSGRLWVSGIPDDPSKIYFSQQVTDNLQYGRMYQFADPLNQDDNVKVETDGGSLTVSGASRILRIQEYKNGVMVFAKNGVWYISGGSGTSFDAVNFNIEKVSNDGIIGEEAAVGVEDKLIYFGYGGAYVLVRDEIYYTLKTDSISDKIDTLWSSIPIDNRSAGKAVYNPSNKRLYFFTNFENYPWTSDRNPYKQPTHFRDVLVLNAKSLAWSKYSLNTDETGDKVAIGDCISFASSSYSVPYIVDNNGTLVYDSSDNHLISLNSPDIDEFVNLCMFMKKSGNDFGLAFGHMDGRTLVDFDKSYDIAVIDNSDNTVVDNNGNPVFSGGERESYSSYYQSAFHTFKELRHKKRCGRVVFAFKRVESGIFNSDGVDMTGGGCLFSPLYNWKNFSASTPVEVYRPNSWTEGYYNGKPPDIDVVYVKERVRGNGNAVQFLFESKEDKDFELLGFQVDITTSERV